MEVVDVRSKLEVLRRRKAAETQLALKINEAVKSGELELDDDAVRGCVGRFSCGLFGPGRRRAAKRQPLALGDAAAAAGSATERVQSASAARLFGQRGKQATAATKLAQASESMQVRVDQLSAKLEETRKRAVALKQTGKGTEALQAMKRAKGIEKQLSSAMGAHEAIERQVDLLAESELQKEVSAALSESVKTVKKKTKGLLSSTETAVDDSHEIKDLADDVAQALGGLQSNDTYDDDELMEELNAIMGTDAADVEVESRPVAAAPPAAAAAEKPAPAYPSAPKTRVGVESQALLAEGE
tara:strand:- start:60 stop:959 length:900 start_codon:yes stop_codon:yes gene_type:complete